MLIDTIDAVRRHACSARDLPGHGLKAAARSFGVAAPERTHVAGAETYRTYQSDPDRVRRYALDDVAEVDGLSCRLMGAAFALAGMAPRPYGRVAAAGPAMGILEPLLVRAYLRAGAALPRGAAKSDGAPAPHQGGTTTLYATGVAQWVVKAGIASMYPSIMRAFRIGAGRRGAARARTGAPGGRHRRRLLRRPEDWTEGDERACVATLAATLPAGIRPEYEGRYRALLSHDVKNDG